MGVTAGARLGLDWGLGVARSRTPPIFRNTTADEARPLHVVGASFKALNEPRDRIRPILPVPIDRGHPLVAAGQGPGKRHPHFCFDRYSKASNEGTWRPRAALAWGRFITGSRWVRRAPAPPIDQGHSGESGRRSGPRSTDRLVRGTGVGRLTPPPTGRGTLP